MKSSFTYNGSRIVLRLELEDTTERAIAALMEKHTIVEVAIERPSYSGYGSESIDAVKFTLRRPEEA